MKKKRMLLGLILCTFLLQAQNFEKDMELVYKYFVNAPRIAFNIKYLLKESHKAESKVLTETSGRFMKEKDTYLSELDKIATLVTPLEILFVDHNDKRINIKKIKAKPPENIDFIKLLKISQSNIETVNKQPSEHKDQLTYKIKIKSSDVYPMSYYEIVINTKTNYLERMTLFYKKTLQENESYGVTGKEIPRLDILFYDFNSPKLNAGQELKTLYYYTKQNAKLIPTINFNGYAIKEVF
jgi:hypothetical protein